MIDNSRVRRGIEKIEKERKYQAIGISIGIGTRSSVRGVLARVVIVKVSNQSRNLYAVIQNTPYVNQTPAETQRLLLCYGKTVLYEYRIHPHSSFLSLCIDLYNDYYVEIKICVFMILSFSYYLLYSIEQTQVVL
jgi:hypothetical protein